MALQNIKILVGAAWLLAALSMAVVTSPDSSNGWITWLAAGIAPPLAMWFLWTEPSPTMSETIRRGRG